VSGRGCSCPSEMTRDSDADKGWDLLGSNEIFVGGTGKVAAGEGDDALIALHSGPWVDGHR
jgi:hypothetical protein